MARPRLRDVAISRPRTGRCSRAAAASRCFGIFHVPNISPDKETGIGSWTLLDFVNAMKWGVAPDGSHLYPAFPYPAYQRLTYEDLIDLKAYLDSLPAVKSEVPPHKLRFPFNCAARSGCGIASISTAKASCPTQRPAPSSIGAPISSEEQAIVRSAIRRAIFSAASSRIPNSPARQILRAKARCPYHTEQ
jgi:hypothetical protein